MKWPGEANVDVAVVHLAKGHLAKISGLRRRLDGVEVAAITHACAPSLSAQIPHPLSENAGLSFQGSIVLGMGFNLTFEERDVLVQKNKRKRGADLSLSWWRGGQHTQPRASIAM